MSKCIGFIGAGNMASSLAGGLIAKGYDANRIIMSDLNESALASAKETLGVNTSSDNSDVVSAADVLVLAVKPQVMKPVVEGLATSLATTSNDTKPPLIISIAAGITVASMAKWFAKDLAIVRCMPNTPALVQSGDTGLYANAKVSEQQKQLAKDILDSVGIALWVDKESDIDAVTALSGSGPAYYFLVMEAMILAGKKLGLDPQVCRELTLHTALGSAKMAIASDDEPAILRKNVTSPGGTTERALECLEAGGLVDLFEQALEGARDRSIELSELVD